MKHILTTTILLLAVVLGISAKTTEAARSVVVERTDGTSIRVNINSGLTVTFADGNAVISGTNDNGAPVTVTAPLSELKSWTLSDEKAPEITGIQGAVNDAASPVIDGMTLSGVAPGARITVVNASGQTVATLVAASDGTATLPFGTLRHGIYLVSTPSGTLKVAVR